MLIKNYEQDNIKKTKKLKKKDYLFYDNLKITYDSGLYNTLLILNCKLFDNHRNKCIVQSSDNKWNKCG